MSVNISTIMNIFVYVYEVKSDDFSTTIFGENVKCKK